MRSTTTGTALLLFLSALVPAVALAQPRAGVAVEELTPPGLVLADVDVPDRDDAPVRLGFAQSEGARPELLVDVLVAPTERRAMEAAAWFVTTVSGEVPARSDVGEHAFGDDRLLGFVRANLFIVVRSLTGTHDVLAVAERIDRAVIDAPAGSPAGESVRAAPATELQVGHAVAITIEGDPLGTYLRGEGPIVVRQTRTGWVVTRTGPGAYRIHVSAVDRRLRRMTTR